VGLFEALDGVAIADPTRANLRAVTAFARKAEKLYWNARLRPVPGFTSTPLWFGRYVPTWFDDNGWWALAFLDAYRATGNPHYVTVAERAMNLIERQGWDTRSGGIWWDTTHEWKAGESLATATLLAARLYQITHNARYLQDENTFVTWGQQGLWNATAGLYRRSNRSSVPMGYVQSPIAAADAIMCNVTNQLSYCTRSETLASATRDWFPPEADMGPQYDAEYLHWLLDLYGYDHLRDWYAIAYYNGQRAIQYGTDPDGLYAGAWDGGNITEHQADPSQLQVDGATLSLFAWLAVAQPPAS
jgi:hypothetical protein